MFKRVFRVTCGNCRQLGVCIRIIQGHLTDRGPPEPGQACNRAVGLILLQSGAVELQLERFLIESGDQPAFRNNQTFGDGHLDNLSGHLKGQIDRLAGRDPPKELSRKAG